jgi:hypothetical protein|tara:strand:- start:988 stop:1323 length:336 start_codon:yes stop_codon:yes gene_type:complete
MAIVKLTFENPINVSAQVGDKIYAISPGVSSVSNNNLVGIIDSIPNNLEINVDDTDGNIVVSANDFIMFQKDNRFNVTSLNGYYADVTLTNEQTDKVELYAVGSEITESSK